MSLALLFPFTAEDAYITYRYAENAIDLGAFVFNPGEPINAMTSPLHAVLSAATYWLTGHTALSQKVLGLALLLGTVVLVWRRYRAQPQVQPLALALVLLPPAVMLWAVGGLETPILLFLVTVVVLLAEAKPRLGLGDLLGLFVLAALAFLTRYDSVLFLAPVVVHAAWRARAWPHAAVAALVAGLMPLAWFAISLVYYGDLLPTSYYVKTPKGDLSTLFYNGRYIAAYLVYVGLVPAAVLALALPWSVPDALRLVLAQVRKRWWLYLGLTLQLLYGLTMATHHMMFSLRFFVPYLPAAALVVVDLVSAGTQASAQRRLTRRLTSLLPVFVAALALLQLFQAGYTYAYSVNGISASGEYRSLGVRDYVRFIHLLQQQALETERHWSLVDSGEHRPPRILTYAAGMLPYTFREAYIYEQLVSYRHCTQRYQQGLHADYLHLLAPRHGTVEQQLPKPAGHYQLVSAHEMVFDGARQQLLVYYDPEPAAQNLSARIGDACP